MSKPLQGQAPYAFRWSKGRLVVEESEAATRRAAFEYFLRLRSLGAVARELNDTGHLTRRGGKWTDVQVARIIECPSAIGVYELNRSARDESGKRRQTQKGERVTIECEPIIPREIWDKAQVQIQAKRAKRTAEGEDKALLSGLVWCGCGGKMYMKADSEKLTCVKCAAKIAAADLEAIFAQDFAEAVADHPALAGALEEPSERRDLEQQLTGSKIELDEIRSEQAGVERLFMDGGIPKPRFEVLYLPLTRRVSELEARIAKLQQKLSSTPPAMAKFSRTDWPEVWKSWPENHRREILISFVRNIVVNGDEVEFDYLLPPPPESAEPRPVVTSGRLSPPTHQQAGWPPFIRLPKPGTRCEYCHLSRAKLNELILPNKRNGFKAPVDSRSMRQSGAKRGVRFIVSDSLLAYMAGAT